MPPPWGCVKWPAAMLFAGALLLAWTKVQLPEWNEQRGRTYTCEPETETEGVIIYTNLGTSAAFQNYMWTSIAQSRLLNPCTPIYLVLFSEALQNADVQQKLARYNVLAIDHSSLSHARLDRFRKTFFVQGVMMPDGNDKFNQYTSERLVAVFVLMDKLKLKNAIHLENDNLLYTPVDVLVHAMQLCDVRLAVPFPTIRSAVVGIAFIQSGDALLPFIDFAINVFAMGPEGAAEFLGTEWVNDMSLLGSFYFKQTMKTSVSELPSRLYKPRNYSTDNAFGKGFLDAVPFYEGNSHSCIAEALPGTIFDGCVLGQYFGGTFAVPDLAHWQADRQFDPRGQHLWWKTGRVRDQSIRLPFINQTRILNLHVHSKRLSNFTSWSI